MHASTDILVQVIDVRSAKALLPAYLFAVYIKFSYSCSFKIKFKIFTLQSREVNVFSEPCKALKFICVCKKACFSLSIVFAFFSVGSGVWKVYCIIKNKVSTLTFLVKTQQPLRSSLFTIKQLSFQVQIFNIHYNIWSCPFQPKSFDLTKML